MTTSPDRGALSGIDRGALSGIASAASFLTGIIGATIWSRVPYPRPGSSPDRIREFFRADPRPARLSVTGQLVSAITLGRFTASAARLARRVEPTGRGLQVAALAGGATATASLAASAAYTALLTTDRADDDFRALSMHRRAFLAGGVTHGVGYGLLVGAVGLTGRRTRLLSPALTDVALASAAAGLLTPLYLITEPAAWLIPIGRFSGFLVIGQAAARLARRSLHA
jgi:hypothetical protein